MAQRRRPGDAERAAEAAGAANEASGTVPQQGEPAADALGPALARLDNLEREFGHLRWLADIDRDRLDWALGALEGLTAQIEHYHAERATPAYHAAYEKAEPLVSVCVTTMDRAELLLGRCIPSLIGQTYRNIEIIVVGDHCTDDTQARLEALRDPRIEFHNLPERGPYPRPGIERWQVAGTYGANLALSLCRGDFITHLDDDDAMAPHRIAAMVAAALQTRADFLWHPLRIENKDGSWYVIGGSGRLEITQAGTGSLFYHRYFASVPWEVMAYRLREAGDWNRIRRIKVLRPRTHFVSEPLAYHHHGEHAPFVARAGERFLE